MRLAFATLCLTAGLSLPMSSAALTCLDPPSPLEQISSEARVLQATPIREEFFSGSKRAVLLRVDHVWKGPLDRYLVVLTYHDFSSLRIGAPHYLAFTEKGTAFTMGKCGYGELTDGGFSVPLVRRVLGEGTPVTPGQHDLVTFEGGIEAAMARFERSEFGRQARDQRKGGLVDAFWAIPTTTEDFQHRVEILRLLTLAGPGRPEEMTEVLQGLWRLRLRFREEPQTACRRLDELAAGLASPR